MKQKTNCKPKCNQEDIIDSKIEMEIDKESRYVGRCQNVAKIISVDFHLKSKTRL